MLGLQLCLPKRFLCWRMDMKQKSNLFLTRPRFCRTVSVNETDISKWIYYSFTILSLLHISTKNALYLPTRSHPIQPANHPLISPHFYIHLRWRFLHCMNESLVSPWLSAASTLGDRFCICVGKKCLYLYCTVFVWVKSGLNTGDKSSPRLLRWGWSAGRNL